MHERCLQEKTGSCLGCPVLELVVNRVNRGTPIGEAARTIAQKYCPEGNEPQTHYLRPRHVYAMGQLKSGQVIIEQ